MATLKVYGLRHGDAPKAESRERTIDLARPLSPLGVQQAQARMCTFAGEQFASICCSPAVRALQTAELATGRGRHDGEFFILPELYTPEGADGEILDQMYCELGHRAPRVYFEHEPYPGFIMNLALTAGRAIENQLARMGIRERLVDQSVLVAGHAVFVPLAVYGLISVFGAPSEKVTRFLHELDMAEADAFCVLFSTENMDATQMTNFD